MKMAATDCMIAVPSMLTVVPMGRTNPVTVVETLPLASVAVQFTVVAPLGKVLPLAGTQDTVGVTVLGPAGPAALDFTRLAVA